MKDYLIDLMCNEDVGTYVNALIDFVTSNMTK